MLIQSGASSSITKQVPKMSERARAALEEQNEQSKKWKGNDEHPKAAVPAKRTCTSSDSKDSVSPSQKSTPPPGIWHQATVEDIPDEDDFFTNNASLTSNHTRPVQARTAQDDLDKTESTQEDELSAPFI